MIKRSLPSQVSRPGGGGLPTLTIDFKRNSTTGALDVRIKQRIHNQPHLFVPRIVTQALKDTFGDVTVSKGTWRVPGPWAAIDIHEVPDTISEILERRGWLTYSEDYDHTGGKYKMRARHDGPTSAKRVLF